MSAKAAAMRANREASAGRSIDEYPLRMDMHHMAEFLGVSLKRAHALDAEGALLRFQNLPTVGVKTFSRDRVKAYLAGETVAQLRDVKKRSA